MEGKSRLFARIYQALRPGDLFVNADVTISRDSAQRQQSDQLWADHMAYRGVDEGCAYRHFDGWVEEDTYFQLEDELAAMRRVGFRCQLRLAVSPEHAFGRA